MKKMKAKSKTSKIISQPIIHTSHSLIG